MQLMKQATNETIKSATQNWCREMASAFPIALTLTLKQTIVEEVNCAVIHRTITMQDAERITHKFKQKLNREIWSRRSADKYGKTLNYIVVIEGERSCKPLHLHFAIGGLPNHVKFNQFTSLVGKAKRHVKHLDDDYKVDLADSGWMDYITKEVATNNNNIINW